MFLEGNLTIKGVIEKIIESLSELQEVLCRPLTMYLLGEIMNQHISESFIVIRSTQNMFYSVVY